MHAWYAVKLLLRESSAVLIWLVEAAGGTIRIDMGGCQEG